ncbi:MAG: hypothetical protein LKJ88_07185 [Bacilli bacterium]|jgi:hypothetical protein|nr:hypothetical protein [Bacilli bacterium]
MKTRLLVAALMSFIMGLAMTLTASLLHQEWGIETLYDFLFALGVGLIFSFLIPLDKISSWFCSLFKIGKEKPFIAAAVGGIATNLVITTLMALAMTAFALRNHISIFFQAFIQDYWVMLLVGYVFTVLGTFLVGLLFFKKPKEEIKEENQ